MHTSNRTKAILPIGRVNVKTGDNSILHNVFTCWPEEDNTVEVWKDEKDNVRLVFSSGCGPVQVGSRHEFHHDQTFRYLGRWEYQTTMQLHDLPKWADAFKLPACPFSYVYK